MTYDDPQLNAFIDLITLVNDPAVPPLSMFIEADTADGHPIVQDQRMTERDFASAPLTGPAGVIVHDEQIDVTDEETVARVRCDRTAVRADQRAS